MIDSKDDMKISVLSSGSGGNVSYIETAKHKILLDAGLSGVKIKKLLSSINKNIEDVDTLLVTHEHNDHCKSVGVLARRYPQISVYANEKTWIAMDSKVGKISSFQKNIFPPNVVLSFDDLDIESFTVSHDAAQAQFYNFHHHNKSFVVLTDIGYISERIVKTIQNANAYVFECNHDVEMLRNGPYAWSLKQRILGDSGHLSNEDGADALIECIGNNTKNIFVGHRSHHNNTKLLAHSTVAEILKRHDFAVGNDFNLLDTDVNCPSKLITL
ncbi:MBL fold metallo-hydrolase [Apilactobacillus xinyiensis]|uniref:MBL fold metallo-hydrolase n=1 Tax=Apilactobacillus xinyiensis TaxID=2841032 RepID=UPI001C7E04F3|nr:MBL fold metallo-hydrolase [Apilactobacillus xinyiensis]MCL0330159.1 MBL fold metallo-hydrolase [Apilactobacillus xinyiensis]